MLKRSLIAAQFTLMGGLLPTPALTQSTEVSVQFTSTLAVISNPERGLVGWAGDLAAHREDGIVAEAQRGYSTQRAHIRLDQFRDHDLTADFLNKLNQGFDAVRRAGVKVIPRFVYNSPEPGPSYRFVAKDAPRQQVLRHIEQLGPVLHTHGDVIAFFEAGFIGAWGEWHTSSNGLTQPDVKEQIKQALLTHFPHRPVMFRTPRDLRRWLPIADSALASRYGFHNDCFLSNDTDANTFQEQADRDFAHAVTRWAPSGGETCAVGARADCTSILSAARQFHLTWLNRYGRLDAFTPTWKEQGCYGEVINRIGYRFELRHLSHLGTVKSNAPVDLTLALCNAGWSRLHNARQLVVHWIAEDQKIASSDVIESVSANNWLPSSCDKPLKLVFKTTAPSAGTYRLALALPDPAARLAADARYAIRFANADQPEKGQYWDAERAVFLTGSQLTVTNE